MATKFPYPGFLTTMELLHQWVALFVKIWPQFKRKLGDVKDSVPLSEPKLWLHAEPHCTLSHRCSPILLQEITAKPSSNSTTEEYWHPAPSIIHLVLQLNDSYGGKSTLDLTGTSHRGKESSENDFKSPKKIPSAAEICHNCSGRQWSETRSVPTKTVYQVHHHCTWHCQTCPLRCN